MTEAIFTLAGVIVGGLLAGAVQIALHRRTEARELKVAKRLLEDELMVVQTSISLALEEQEAGADEREIQRQMRRSLREIGSLQEIWNEHRSTLAVSMKRDNWRKLQKLVTLIWMTAHSPGPLSTDELKEEVDKIEAVLETLRC